MKINKLNNNKSPSVSSVDSGLDNSTRKKMKPETKNASVNYNKQLLQASNLSAKKQMLRKSLLDANKKAQGLLEKLKRRDSESSHSDEEDINNFSPEIFSTQKDHDTPSSSSEDDNSSSTGRPKVQILNDQLIMPENKSISSQQSSSSEETTSSDDDETHVKIKSTTQGKPLEKSPKPIEKKSKPNRIDTQLMKQKSYNNVSGDSSENEESIKAESSSSSEEVSDKEIPQSSQLTGKSSKCPHLLKDFFESNPKLKLKNLKLLLDSSDDENIFCLQVPKSVPLESLKTLPSFHKNATKMRIEGHKYVFKPQPEVKKEHIVSGMGLKKTPLETFRIEKYVKTKNPDEVLVEKKEKQRLPDSLKVRHPLFGSDYQSKIQLEDEIKKKIRQALDRFNVKEKKKKKKKMKVEEDDNSILISKLLEEKINKVQVKQEAPKEIELMDESSSTKPRKKRGKKELVEQAAVEFNVKLENPRMESALEDIPTKKKRNKSSKEITELVENVERDLLAEIKREPAESLEKFKNPNKNIGSTVEDNPKKKKSKERTESNHEDSEIAGEIIYNIEGIPEKSKKKKKRKRENDEDISLSDVSTIFENSKRQKLIPSSTFIADDTHDFKLDISEIKPTKCKRTSEESSNHDLINSLLNTVKNNLDSSKVKKGKKNKVS